MHDQQWEDIHRAIEHMSDGEKRDLLEEISRSLDDSRHRPGSNAMTAEQRQAVADLLREIEQLPAADEPADGLIASRDHDEILYGRSRKANPPERPAT